MLLRPKKKGRTLLLYRKKGKLRAAPAGMLPGHGAGDATACSRPLSGLSGTVRLQSISGKEEDYNCITDPERVTLQEEEAAFSGSLSLPANGFVVARIPVKA